MKQTNPTEWRKKMYGYNEIEFECYFDGELVEYERWTDRGWMYRTPKEPKTLYFQPKYAHSKKVLKTLSQ